uniref:Myb/SANT-like DNA-binding domain-containing protein n=1 Tax=Timema shepardi TaxID=629360 RepID=A0A7R9FYD1_TIMSH|nr:unnamed protein product [Timema shepardi]
MASLVLTDSSQLTSDSQHLDENIWTLRNATPLDDEATETFINLVGSERYQNLLNDKKSTKTKVWEKIFEEMTSIGYKIASNTKEGGAKCSQKWRNLERSYLQFIHHVKATRNDTKLPPKHYDLLHNILSKKYKDINLPVVLDTMEMCSPNKKYNLTESTRTHIISTNNPQPASNIHLAKVHFKLDSNDPQPSTPSHNNFSNSISPDDEPTSQLETDKSPARPGKVTCNDILNLIKTEAKAQEQRFNTLCDLLREQNRQRERLTDTLVNFFNNIGTDNSKKRKKHPSDSE